MYGNRNDFIFEIVIAVWARFKERIAKSSILYSHEYLPYLEQKNPLNDSIFKSIKEHMVFNFAMTQPARALGRT